MNIFFLDKNPIIAAKYLCTVHLVSQIKESAQMLSTCVNYYLNNGNKLDELNSSTHFNHPCNIWLRESLSNVEWLYNHATAMNNYRMANGCDSHKSWDVCHFAWEYAQNITFQHNKLTTIYLSIPVEIKNIYGVYEEKTDNYRATEENAVKAYREYYCTKEFKKKEIKWFNDEVPYWYMKKQ